MAKDRLILLLQFRTFDIITPTSSHEVTFIRPKGNWFRCQQMRGKLTVIILWDI